MTGFEPAASCSQSRRATKLRYIPYEAIIDQSVSFQQIQLNRTEKKISKTLPIGPKPSQIQPTSAPNRTKIG
jgi:hypothetical protein